MNTEIENALAGSSWEKIWDARVAGKIEHADILEMVKEIHRPGFEMMCEQWMTGTLFRSQKIDFEGWLNADEFQSIEENKQAKEYLAFELGCSQEPNADIHRFINKRIFKFGFSRRQAIAEDRNKTEICRSFWRQENETYNWNWR